MKHTFAKFLLFSLSVFAISFLASPAKVALAVEDPQTVPVAGTYHSNVRVIFNSNETATNHIKYTFTTDGTTPATPGCASTRPGTVYSSPITIAVSTTFEAITCTSPTTGSSVVPFVFIIAPSGNSGGGGSTSNPTDIPGGPTCDTDATLCPPATPLNGNANSPLVAPVFANVLANDVSTVTRDLAVGTSGADVVSLQQFLISKGYMVLPQGVALGYFGSMTRDAAIKFQKSVGVTPAVGYVGAKTRAHINALTGILPTSTTVVTPLMISPLVAPTAATIKDVLEAPTEGMVIGSGNGNPPPMKYCNGGALGPVDIGTVITSGTYHWQCNSNGTWSQV